MQIPRTVSALPTLLLVAACATSQPATPGAVTPAGVTERINTSIGDVSSSSTEIHGTTSTAVDSLAMSADQAWTFLPAVFEGLGLTVTNANAATRSIQGQVTRSRRPFGGKTFAQLLNCGEVGGVPVAARSDITMTVVATLTGSGEQSALTTQVHAVASAMSTNTSQTRCTANGGIGDILAARLKAAKGGQ